MRACCVDRLRVRCVVRHLLLCTRAHARARAVRGTPRMMDPSLYAPHECAWGVCSGQRGGGVARRRHDGRDNKDTQRCAGISKDVVEARGVACEFRTLTKTLEY